MCSASCFYEVLEDMVQEKGSRERCSSWTVLHAQCTSALSSRFPRSQGNAEALDRWGGKTKHRLISYFLSNTSTKNYRNRTMYVKIMASWRWDVFLRHSVEQQILWTTVINEGKWHRSHVCLCDLLHVAILSCYKVAEQNHVIKLQVWQRSYSSLSIEFTSTYTLLTMTISAIKI